MSKVHGSGTEHFVDQFRVSCVLNTAALDIKRPVLDARTFCGNDKIAGFHESAVSFNGFGDFGAGLWETNFDTLFRAGANVNYTMIMGNTAGSRAYETVGLLTKDSMPISVSAIVGLNGAIDSAQYVSRMLALNVETAVTTTGVQTGQSHQITTTETVVATIRVTAVSGAGSVTFAVQGSSDNAVGDPYATDTNFTGSGSALVTTGAGTATFTGMGIARLTSTSATELWKRINCTAFSGFTSVTLTATIGIQVPN